MAVLQAVSGETPGKTFAVSGSRVTIGRHPQCEVVLEHVTVSRQHAQILLIAGEYVLEDLSSRNGTLLNGKHINGRSPLTDGDRIELSDVVLQFRSQTEHLGDTDPTLEPIGMSSAVDESRLFMPAAHAATQDDQPVLAPADDDPSQPSEIVHKLDARTSSSGLSSNLKVIQAKLQAVLEISRALSRVLELDDVLPRILQTLFKTFPQADQGFILLLDPKTERLKVKASRTRTNQKADAVAVSMTVVRKAMTEGEAILSASVPDDSRFAGSTSLTQLQICSVMCAPLLLQDGRAIGVIQIDSRDVQREFQDEDLELLVAVASQAAMVVENAQLHEERLTQRDMERDLEFARQVQRGFLPNERPQVEGYSFSDYYEAAKSVGGDYYDYIPLPDGRIVVTLGDVAGKGVSAALLMARLYSSARYLFLIHGDPAIAVTKLNEDIVTSGMGQRFITFVVMVLDPEKGTLTLVNAGHMPPVIRFPDGHTETVSGDVSSLPLGILPDTSYQSTTVDFPPGAAALAFTDGVTEAMSRSRELYGRERLQQIFSTCDGDIRTTMQTVVGDVRDFAGDSFERDDTCLVAFLRRA